MLIKMPHFSEYSDDEPFLRADYLVGIASEFVWIRSGQAVLYCDGEEITVSEIQVVYYDPRRDHNWRNPHDTACKMLLVRQR